MQIHFKQTGKEDAGSVISAYLQYAQLTSTANDSARFFTARRMTLARNIIPPSNARYAGYVGDIIRGAAPHKSSVRIEKLVLTKVPRFNSQGNGLVNRLSSILIYHIIRMSPVR